MQIKSLIHFNLEKVTSRQNKEGVDAALHTRHFCHFLGFFFFFFLKLFPVSQSPPAPGQQHLLIADGIGAGGPPCVLLHDVRHRGGEDRGRRAGGPLPPSGRGSGASCLSFHVLPFNSEDAPQGGCSRVHRPVCWLGSWVSLTIFGPSQII